MKRTITIVIIVLIVLGFGYWLFKISPDTQTTASKYALSTSGVSKLTELPAFDPSADHFQGDAAAKNVLMEYGDYQCPHCAEFNEIVKQLMPQLPTSTVFVYRDFPLEQIHANADISSLAANAAGAQGKYWEMHDILFQKQTDWQDLADPLDKFAEYAQQVGVKDINQFKSDITNQKYKADVERDNKQALGLNLQGTPTFYFNGHQLQLADVTGLKTQIQPFIAK